MDFSEKITIEDFIIRVLPGGFFLAVLFFAFNMQGYITASNGNLDFLYSFLFFCTAFIFGEVLQTITHIFEFLVDIFFKGYRPSEIFLYKNNPIIEDNKTRNELAEKLDLTNDEKEFFNKDYKKLSLICAKNNVKRKTGQDLFWKIFTNVEMNPSVKRSNINYLFSRVIMIEFLILSCVLFFINNTISLSFFAIFIILLWRARGLAKGLVFKSVMTYIK
jgi:hypothetical protein